MSTHAPVDAATRAAVDWLLRLEASAANSDLHQAFNAWLAQDPQHHAAWQRLGALLEQPIAHLRDVESRHPGQLQAATQALAAPDSPPRRKVLGGGLALLLLGLGAGALVNRTQPLSGWLADQHTATGERKTITLADGSRLSLNARSAVDIHFTPQQRLIRLRAGTVFVDVAPDTRRPFVIATAQGEVQALGTQFLVRQEEGASLASVQLHSVKITTGRGRQQQIRVGEAARFTEDAIVPMPLSAHSRADWRDGRIDIRDEPLGLLVDALRAYRPGILRISPQAAQIRVYGIFPLDSPEHTLHSLVQTLPLSVTTYGAWLTLIDVR